VIVVETVTTVVATTTTVATVVTIVATTATTDATTTTTRTVVEPAVVATTTVAKAITTVAGRGGNEKGHLSRCDHVILTYEYMVFSFILCENVFTEILRTNLCMTPEDVIH